MTLEEIKKEMDKTDQEICSIEYVADDPEKYNELCRKMYRLTEIYKVLSCPKVASSDELDIYAENKGFNNVIYHLMLHNNSKEVGYVRVTYKETQTMYGNIGYEIRLPYRGNNFAFKAIEMLEETMLQNGLTNPILTAYPTNLASIRVIEKLGGVLIGDVRNNLTYNKYEIDLLKKKEKRREKILKHS